MILEQWQKTGTVFDRVFEITNMSFVGFERPPREVLEGEFTEGKVFVNDPVIDCYAILSEKFGEPYVWSIATDPTARGQGFASKLLDEIENYVRALPASGIGLMTHVNNPAQKLYFDKGYRVLKFWPNYYITGDGLQMRRKLL